MTTNKFDRDTAVRQVSEGLYEGRIDPDWWIERGPNGGYVAAIMLRALSETGISICAHEKQGGNHGVRVPRVLTSHR